MRIWRTDKQLSLAWTYWIAGNLNPSPGSPGQFLLHNDDGTVFGVGLDGKEHNYPAGTDDQFTRCYLPESRTAIGFGATGAVYGILVFA